MPVFCELCSACGSIVAGEFFKGWGLRRNVGIGGVPFTGWEDPDCVCFFLPSAGVRDMCYHACFFVFVFKLFCLIIKVSGQSRPFHSTSFSNSSLVILLLRLPPGGKGDQRV